MKVTGATILCLFILASCKREKITFVITNNNMANTITIGSKVTFEEAGEIRKNDVIVYSLPDNDQYSCLRVVGLPGDKIEILNGILLVNGTEYKQPNSSTAIYTVHSKKESDFKILEKYNLEPYSENYAMVKITRQEFAEIKKNNLVDSIYPLGFDSNYVFPGILKTKTSKYFNHYFFGPVYVPKVGDKVSEYDKMLIEKFTVLTSFPYVVNDEYFFCLGDSFSDAQDSRIIGLIPKKKIVGKVTSIQTQKVLNYRNNEL